MYIKFWARAFNPRAISRKPLKTKFSKPCWAGRVDLSDPAAVKRHLERLPWTVQGTAGGNTPCIEVRSGDQLLILDAGSACACWGLT